MYSRLACVLVVSLACIRSARAEGPLAIVNLKFTEGSDEERATLRAAIERAARDAGVQLVPQTQIDQAAHTSKDLFDCFVEDRCRADLGLTLRAGTILTGLISKEDGAWTATLGLFDVEVATTAKSLQAACPKCGADAFAPRLAKLTSELIRADRQLGRGTIVVRTRPPGAQVRVDDRPVGSSNLEVAVVAGTHVVELRRDGGQPVSMPVEVRARERKPLEVTMPTVSQPVPVERPSKPRVDEPPPTIVVPPPPPGVPEHRAWWKPQRIAGVTILAAGIGLAIASIPLLAIDGKCSDEGACIFKRDTATPGYALLGSGLGLAAVGGIVLLTTPKHASRSSAAVALAPSFLAVSGRLSYAGMALGGSF